ncbi:hypothetical protein [Actinobacillus equuli]|uniref:hypothetical protein n=1 Tax=Actinobacillus equuli TaxID=718 RepID=UPI0024417AAC|nr:hypothetical protein [Actinobacillus equuli]WGE85009.1 hypothetical protein NYR87_07730 [Actinobacillus equuli subsp. haemolyticus]
MNSQKNGVAIFIIVLSILLYSIYITKNNDISSAFGVVYIIVAYIICLPFLIKETIGNKNRYDKLIEKYKNTFSKKAKEEIDKELEKFSWGEEILKIVVTPLIFAWFAMPIISYPYTRYLGQDTTYFAEVYDKESSGHGRSKYYYTKIKSDSFGRETLTSRIIYNKFPIKSKLIIKKRISLLGSYIDYDYIKYQ